MVEESLTRRQFLRRLLRYGAAVGGGATLMGILWMLEGGEDEPSTNKKDPSQKGKTVPFKRLKEGKYKHPRRFVKPPAPPITPQEAKKAGLSVHPAMHWGRFQEGGVECRLCPRRCILGENGRGPCGVRVNWGGKMHTLVYGKPVALHIDPIEKKPLNHFYPGTTALSIATAGCNFGCIFCQNWHISQVLPEKCSDDVRWTASTAARILNNKKEKNSITPEELIRIAKIYKCKSIAFTYTEPTIFYEYMYDTCKLAHKEGIKTVWVTCGFIEETPLRKLCKYLDAANVDLKGYSDDFYARYCGAELEPVLRTLKILKEEKVWFEITNLLIPGANDDGEMIKRMCLWIKKELGETTPVFFSRFFPHYRLKDRPQTPIETLRNAAKIGTDVGLKFIYIGNIGEPETTYCPFCGKALVKRGWKAVMLPDGTPTVTFVVEFNHIKGGKCSFCGRRISGVWGD